MEVPQLHSLSNSEPFLLRHRTTGSRYSPWSGFYCIFFWMGIKMSNKLSRPSRLAAADLAVYLNLLSTIWTFIFF